MPRQLKQCDAFRVSPRSILRPGDCLRFRGGGPVYHGDDGSQHRLPLSGRFQLRRILKRGKRVWVEVAELSEVGSGAIRTAFISGRAYQSDAGLLVKPYKVRKLRATKHSTPRKPR